MVCVVKPSLETLTKTRTLRQKEINITMLPIKPAIGFEIAFLQRPLIKKPKKGNKGIK